MPPSALPEQHRAASSPLGGVIRPARRPPGWVAPGPRPATPDRPDIWPGPGEDLCYLAGDFRILQRIHGHRWSTDDLVTAWAAAERLASLGRAPAPPQRLVDLGCGIGTVLLFLAWRFPAARCSGVEAQEMSAGLARRSIAWNGVDGRCEVRLGDLRDPEALEGLAPADLVTGTPPYLPKGAGIESDREQCGPCRFEYRGGVEAYCLAAARVLAREAPFVGCIAARQRSRVVEAAEAAGLALETWRDVIPKHGKAPLFSVFSMRRPEVAGGLVEEPPLVVRGPDGRFTAEFDEIRRAMGMPV